MHHCNSLDCSLKLVPMQALYARAAARFPSFHEPQLGWWNRRKVPKADKVDEGELAALEDRLSLEEIAHFRAGAPEKRPFIHLDFERSQDSCLAINVRGQL